MGGGISTIAIAFAAQALVASPLEASADKPGLARVQHNDAAETRMAAHRLSAFPVAAGSGASAALVLRASNIATHRTYSAVTTMETLSIGVEAPAPPPPGDRDGATRDMQDPFASSRRSGSGTTDRAGAGTGAGAGVTGAAPPVDPFSEPDPVDPRTPNSNGGGTPFAGAAPGVSPFPEGPAKSSANASPERTWADNASKEDHAYYDTLARPGLSDARRARVGRDLIIGGSVLLASSWLVAGWWGANAFDGADASIVGVPDNTDSSQRRVYGATLMVPVVGPFVAAPFAGSATEAYLTSTIFGATQAGGLAMIITGAISRKRALARLRFQATPMANGGLQFRVGGRF